eukprot:TRINITY_DN59383_c0_g1_i1.p1 TRINITY_DN59383_c0_g1~~TRINITY_DN59383_c0_g1_i1.p1  ORF type:complete len:815 (-),score=143.91 TRINITY_DN59383_c0_g1_i1:694-3138(-)
MRRRRRPGTPVRVVLLQVTSSLLHFSAASLLSPLGSRHWKALFGNGSTRIRSSPTDFVVDGKQVKLYIYDMPGEYAEEPLAWANTFAQQAGSNCDYMLTPCTEQRWAGKYTILRQQGAEVLILAKMLTAGPEVLTDDPAEADLFVVPYVVATTCRMHGWAGHACVHSRADHRQLIEILPHYSASTAHRHVFLASNDAHSAPLIVQMQPIFVTVGPKMAGTNAVLVPPAVVDEETQPRAVADVNLMAGRNIWLWYAASPNNVVRLVIQQQLISAQAYLPKRLAARIALRMMARNTGAGNGGKDAIIADSSPAAFADEMRRSQLCICPPAENTNGGTKRLFDVLLNGCVPVVVSFPSAAPEVGESWWRHGGPPLAWSLPFWDDVDWRSLVVTVPFEVVNATRLVAYLRALPPAAIEAKRANILQLRGRLLFDFDASAPDAFTSVFREIARAARSQEELTRRAAPSHLRCVGMARLLALRIMPGTDAHDKEWSHGWGELSCAVVASSFGDGFNVSRQVETLVTEFTEVELWKDEDAAALQLVAPEGQTSLAFQYCQDQPSLRSCTVQLQDATNVGFRLKPCPFRGFPHVSRACRWVADLDRVKLRRSLVVWPVLQRPARLQLEVMSAASSVLHPRPTLRIIEVSDAPQISWASAVVEHILAATMRSDRLDGHAGNHSWFLMPVVNDSRRYMLSESALISRRNSSRSKEAHDLMAFLITKGPLFDRFFKEGDRPKGCEMFDSSTFTIRHSSDEKKAMPGAMEVRHRVLRKVNPIRWKKLLAMQHRDPWETWYCIFELLMETARRERIVLLGDPEVVAG